MLNIEELLSSIESNTDTIADILAVDGRLGIEQIKELSKLYDNRQLLLDELKKWHETDEADRYFKSNSTAFKKRINTITEKDKKQLDNIESRANDLKSKLKKMSKQKSVLIYSKES
jgi:hypothetical protein